MTTSDRSPSKTLKSTTPLAALTALGIVYGDLGTSPLYTLQTVVLAMGGRFTPESALGVLSLIVWTLIITISVKYCVFVMRADNHGEGGILALMSLIGANTLKGRGALLTMMGLLGAALLYGDGAITPAISVLSALEGVNIVTSAMKPFIMPLAVVILFGLFVLQKFGTAIIGRAFGPIMLVWFVTIAVLGVGGIVRRPDVLAAVFPGYAISFLAHSGAVGPLVVGGVFLCITGGEALYADMGHIGRFPIRLSWYAVVLPALLLSYAGQTALLIQKGTIQGNPFFQLAPAWSIYPLVVLATLATIIASQAIITGAFSMTRQAMQLSWLPAMRIRQTSNQAYGQIYVPTVNWLLMAATIGITIGFGSSDRLAGAYGTAVSTTMLLTTVLLYTAMRRVWRWPPAVCAGIGAVFLIVDLGFFSANLLKILDGGWLPLTLGALVFFIMTTWRTGVDVVRKRVTESSTEPEAFFAVLDEGKIPRVPGTAIFLTRTTQRMPPLMADHIKHMGALQRNVIALSVVFEEQPHVDEESRCSVEHLTHGIWRMTARFGFFETPDLQTALSHIGALDPSIDLKSAVFFGTRDLVVHRPGSRVLSHGRLAVFAFLYRNALKFVDRFHLPPENSVEIARQIEI
ncbi:KUP/HAK/KT family potassium transporter [Caulobacter sp. S45]|uniref:potassium transporter Kup n=1 Tax=Caulobacter sp. S45 TaxID=1641861 RepID=UPI00131C82AF